MCINQMFRPKISIPSWARPDDIGDCTTCQPCKNNLECGGYYPAPGLIEVEVVDNDNGRDGVLDDSGGVCNSSSRSPSDNKTS
jgi:hypothetical protein